MSPDSGCAYLGRILDTPCQQEHRSRPKTTTARKLVPLLDSSDQLEGTMWAIDAESTIYMPWKSIRRFPARFSRPRADVTTTANIADRAAGNWRSTDRQLAHACAKTCEHVRYWPQSRRRTTRLERESTGMAERSLSHDISG